MLAVIDGDVLAYRAAAAVQKAFDWDGDGQKVYVADPKEAIRAAQSLIAQWVQAAGADDYLILQSDRRAPKTSFRYQVHPLYKAQRGTEKPATLLVVEDYLREKHGAEFLRGLEGDDAIGVAVTGRLKGAATVVVSPDKDMRTIPGRCFTVPHMRRLDTAKVERIDAATARWHMFMQALTGDPVDNYKGAPGVGPKKAAEFLGGARSTLALWEKTLAAFEWAWENDTRLGKLGRWVHAEGEAGFWSEAIMNIRCAKILHAADYREDTGEVALWNPPGTAPNWVMPF